MSKVFVSILLLFLTFSLYGEEVKKEEGKNQEKTQAAETKKDDKKSDKVKADTKKKEEKAKEEKKAEKIKKQEVKKEDETSETADSKNIKVQKAIKQTENETPETKKKEEKVESDKTGSETETPKNNSQKNVTAENKNNKSKKAEIKEETEKVVKTEKENVKNIGNDLKKESENEVIKKDNEDASKNEAPKKYSLSMVLNSSLGQGTFVYNEYARNPLFSQTLMIAPGYRYDDISLRMSISASMEYTKSDSTTHPNQIIFSDLGLSASKSLYKFKSSGINLGGAFKLVLPTSMASQKKTLIFASVFSLRLNKTFGKVTLGYSGSFKKNFNKYTSSVIKKEDLSDFNTYGREGGAEILENDIIATGGNNVSFSLTNSLMLNYGITDTVSVGMNLAYSQAWVYRSFNDDDLTADNAKTGRGYRDILMGGFDLSWQINDRFGLSTGISTAQLPKMSDQKGYRFPWFNFSTPADNSSMFFLDINATF